MAEYLEDKKDAALDDVVQQLTKNLSPEKLPIFDKIQRGKEAEPHIIEKLKKIDNIQDYSENFELFGDQLDVNNVLLIHPNALFQMTDEECTTLIKHSKDLKKGKSTAETFYKKSVQFVKSFTLFLKTKQSPLILN